MKTRETQQTESPSGEVHLDPSNREPLEMVAMSYLSQGFHLLPIHGLMRTDESLACMCGRDCRSPGKHPITRSGLKAATNSKAKVLEWLNKYPGMNLAIATGERSNLLVIDIDLGGPEALEELVDYYSLPEDPCIYETRTVLTKKGRHLYFRFPSRLGLKSLTRIDDYPIDSRANGGYVLAPPSLHVSGISYRWEDENIPIMDAPKWLAGWLAECQEKNSASLTNSKACSTGKLPETIKEGQRNHNLFRYACGLVQSFSPEEVLARLRAINENRCEPPMEDSEIVVIHRSAEKWRKK